MFVVFGLTGGIACGKSTVSAFMARRGVGISDADQLARDVVAPGRPALAELVASFGPSVLLPSGELDRKRLGSLVFGDEAARKRLEAITHPRIRQASIEHVQQLIAAGHRLIAYEAALLVENDLQDQFRPLVVVISEPQTQLARLMARDGISEDDALVRVRSQMPVSEKVAKADHVIDTSGSLDDVRERTDEVIDLICAERGLFAEAIRPRRTSN